MGSTTSNGPKYQLNEPNEPNEPNDPNEPNA